MVLFFSTSSPLASPIPFIYDVYHKFATLLYPCWYLSNPSHHHLLPGLLHLLTELPASTFSLHLLFQFFLHRSQTGHLKHKSLYIPLSLSCLCLLKALHCILNKVATSCLGVKPLCEPTPVYLSNRMFPSPALPLSSSHMGLLSVTQIRQAYFCSFYVAVSIFCSFYVKCPSSSCSPIPFFDWLF